MRARSPAVLTTASILLMKELLGGIIGQQGGLAGTVTSAVGEQAALTLLAVLLVGTYVGASVMAYDSEVMQQRLVKVLELGTGNDGAVDPASPLALGFCLRPAFAG